MGEPMVQETMKTSIDIILENGKMTKGMEQENSK